MDKNLTDNEIKKALECEIECNKGLKKHCIGCLLQKHYPYCEEKVIEYALDLINRLQVENENYSKNNRQMTSDILKLYKGLEQAKAENDDFKFLYENLKSERLETIKAIKYHKSEAYKEFAERLKEKGMPVTGGRGFEGVYVMCSNIVIDDLLKELVGENDG